MMVFYREYKYSVLATLFSLATFLFGLVGIVCTILAFKDGSIVGGIIFLLVAAACGYEFFTHKIANKIGDKCGEKNIKTKARYGKLYVEEHPDRYEQILAINRDFAKKYVRNVEGKIVRRKG